MGCLRGHKRQRRGARDDSALAPEVRVENDVEENGTEKRRTQITPTKTSFADDVMFDLPPRRKESDRPMADVSSEEEKEPDEPVTDAPSDDEDVVEIWEPIIWNEMVDDFTVSYVKEVGPEEPKKRRVREYDIPRQPIHNMKDVPKGWSPLDNDIDPKQIKADGNSHLYVFC